MKIVFSTKNVSRATFLDTCRYAFDYGFEGFEIYDAIKERSSHHDSILRRERIADAKRKLVNRNISVSALRLPDSIDSESVTSDLVVKYVNMAAASGISNVIVRIDEKIPFEALDKKLSEAIKKAENSDVNILFETVGVLANTELVIDIINYFSSAVIGASWNVRGTYFSAGETAETTIKTLGAYIKYVRLGDMKDGKTVLIGEGELDVAKLLGALSSLNYEGYICAAWNEEINDADIVLTHFANYISQLNREKKTFDKVYYNRDKTGTFAWKKYDVIDATFSDVLDTMAEKYPDQYAFKYPTLDYTRTYEQFRRDVDECAAALISLGVKAGDHVAIWATNVPQWYITFWATTKIGAVLVTVNTEYKIHEIKYLLQQSDTHTLVMIESYKSINYKEIIQELCPELENLTPGGQLYSKNLPFLRNIVTVGFSMQGCLTWEQMLSRSSLVPREEVRRRASLVKPDDVCNMQYTSGTTGFPKGVMLTHRNIVNNGKTIGDRMDLSTADRMMIQVPMFHCFGMVLSMTSTMTHGGTLYPIPYFSPKSSLACVNDEKITCFNGVPTMFIAMFGHADFAKTDFSHMRTGIMAGANCPADLMRRAADEMNMREIISVYGQTEASPGCTMGEVNEDIDHRVETVGSAFPGVECRIIDPETGDELPAGESGEFVARGFNIMKGYYKMPEATAQAIDNEGWLHTGDIACKTSDGYYKITGRLKDMIIRGGENLYPREIEEFYLTNPKVRDVQVVGVPDERYGEECCAWVILHKGETADENEMKEFGNASIARHKVPRYFVFVNEFPMNAAGKILKYKMREEAVEMLGLKKAVAATDRFYSSTAYGKGTVEHLVKAYGGFGIDHAIVQSVATTPHQVKSINEFIAKEVESSNGFLTGLGTLHPDSSDIAGDIEHLKELGLKGVKLHPDIQDFKVDKSELLKIYELCEEQSLPILMHTGDYRYDNSNPNRVLPILKAYPRLTVIGAHFGGWSVWEEACESFAGLPNFYVDCSSSFEFAENVDFKELTLRYGTDRVLFGSDYPMWSAKDVLERFFELGLSEEDNRKILSENAIKLFNI